MSTQHSMQALQITEANGSFKLTEQAIPQPGIGQVLVKVVASSINPLDLKIRAGQAAHAKQPFPAVLGIDMAGKVVATGPSITHFTVTDRVYGMTGGVAGQQGSLAQYQLVDADLLAKAPSNISLRQAAAMPLVVITAWEGLIDRARVAAGHKVLVQGGAGGVGHVAVQLAKAFGAEVYATASAKDADYIRSLGAVFIDYQHTSVEHYLAEHTGNKGFDIVFNTTGGVSLDQAFQSVKTYTGHVVSSLGWGTHSIAPLSFRAASYSGVFTLMPLLTGQSRAHHGNILRQASQLTEQGMLTIRLDPQEFDFDSIEQAYEKVATARNSGKVVVTVEA
ncbi:MAG: zinc-dependent alcohol dehydrogenase family protein [Gammaproteobacteria bacterium]|nr:zinc-dependent alcohol dehydrogenase family protein [Gammaproteobacteria bacterium]